METTATHTLTDAEIRNQIRLLRAELLRRQRERAAAKYVVTHSVAK